MLMYQDLSDKLLRMAFEVHSIFGPGLLESAYEAAMIIELENAGIPFENRKVFPLYYKGMPAGRYIADIVVDGKIILELKAVKTLDRNMEAQTLNYLKVSGIEVGYLFNFYPASVQWKRFFNRRE